MDSFIYKADTMRGRTQLALNIVELKKKINRALGEAADNGEYWCHVQMPSLIKKEVIDELVADLIQAKFKVKVTQEYINFNNDRSKTNGRVFCLTILWAPEDIRVTFDGEDWE